MANKRKHRYVIIGAASAAIIVCAAAIAPARDEGSALSVDVTVSKEAYRPGDTVVIGVGVKLPDRYHLYGNPMGPGIGKPLSIGISGAGDVRWLDILKTAPKKYLPPLGEWVWAYEKEAFFFLRGIVGGAGEVNGKVVFNGLICHTSCFPQYVESPFTVRIDPRAPRTGHFESKKELFFALSAGSGTMAIDREGSASTMTQQAALSAGIGPAEGGGTVPEWKFSPLEAKAGMNLAFALLFGFLAGIILNAMPCVLPVLGIKLLSFAQGSGGSRKESVIHSLVFSAGVLSVFLLLAGVASFANYSWGKQFQDPKALIAIVTCIVVFAMGMFDVYLLTVPYSIANLNTRKPSGRWGDFFNGVFATILATPCSGPFLGAVLAWAVTQPPPVIFIVYASIGAGMAFPYIVLSSSRRLAKSIPKPGPWMEDFKKVMGFLLLGFAVYLLFGLPGGLVVPTVLFCVLLSLSLSIYGRYAPWGSSIGRKAVSLVAALAVAGGGFYLSFMVTYPMFSKTVVTANEAASGVWRDFSADSLRDATAKGRPVLLDFTANWCMNCQYNYVMVLSKPEVTGLIKTKNVLAMKVDMTAPNPAQDSLLRSLGSRSIPFLALIPGATPDRPVVMRDILTKGRVLRELRKLE